ncbi:MAG: MerR family transcriptional regulator [Actinobacteria bacterium]|nr:MerR family transcriptional regulator [Actinomycetota bacterium]
MNEIDGGVRIGELARRTGVSPDLLRAWEQRYGLLRPDRSPGGFRLYSRHDEARVRRMTELIGQGVSAAEAARQARSAPEPSPRSPVDDIASQLRTALDSFDDQAAHAALDRLFATVSVGAALAEVLIPYLHELGMRWAAGSASVAQEHFAASLIRGRLLGLARDWGAGLGPSVLLACLPGEAHDLGLVAFGVLLARRGWRVTFLGADTPFDALAGTVRTLRPALVVLHTVNPDRFDRHAEDIRGLAARAQVAMPAAGGVGPERIAATGARPLPADIVAAAGELRP